ncbi:MAG TPA: tetratricopeptide repeat protein [Thermoguttaceae bacterium]|nr:tetratricopeptide repeat protein [Thermoguttaceae bacterium]
MQQELTLARRCFESGDLEQAERLFRRVVDVDPSSKEALQALGVVALRAGRIGEACDLLRRAVAADPADALLQNHLGAALASREDFDEAEECLRRAIEIDPNLSDAHYNLAKTLRSRNKPEEAVAHYRAALQLAPKSPEIHYNLANTLRELGRLDEAVACYRDALRIQPGYVKARNNLGNVLREQGKLDEAAAEYRQSLRLKPDYAEGHHNLGLVLAAGNKLEEAVQCYRRAIQLKPAFAAARNSLGKALVKQGKLDEAAEVLASELATAEECVDGYLKLAEKLRTVGRLDEAVAYARKAIEARSDLAAAHNSLGLAMLARNEPEEAIACYRKALEIRPDLASVHNNLAVALQTLGRFDQCLESIQTALRLRPQFVVAHLNRAVCWLRKGDFEPGWHEFEWRQLSRDHRVRRFPSPLWDGREVAGGTILLHAEQGLGDTLQFVRYAPLVKQRCRTLVLQCPKRLAPLLERCAGIDRLVAKGDPLPDFDFHTPLMSLPCILGTTLDSIPDSVPYVFAGEQLAETWRTRLAEFPGFKIGIAWQGNKKYAGDAYRSIPLRHFAPLAKIPGVRLFSLQRGRGCDQLADLPDGFEVHDFGEDFDRERGAFMDAAAVVQNLDLVITSDTAIPHLAGAMGVPVWVALHLSSDWRWLDAREDSPWYPTMRLFRQRRLGDWEELFGRMAEELGGVVAGDYPGDCPFPK